MTAYYNENDKTCAEWTRRLIRSGSIADGVVDERDIRDVCPADLRGFTQCHFFSGIALWCCALRLAGWPDDRPVWTGSLPCEPFAAPGKRTGFADQRHVWPDWFWLIEQCRPCVVFGEQSAGGHGLLWLDLILTDMEARGYACGAVDFPSAGVGAPCIRQRLWWVGHAGIPRLPHPEPSHIQSAQRGAQGRATEQSGGSPHPWRDVEWIDCADRKRRPAQSRVFPLAARHPGDVAKIRAYGNALNPKVAVEVIRAYMGIT
jgi:DNA (cytosine-5)-methyltransferase 1